MEDKDEQIRTLHLMLLLDSRIHAPSKKNNKESIFVSSFEPVVGRWLRLPCSSSAFFFMLKQRDDSEKNLVYSQERIIEIVQFNFSIRWGKNKKMPQLPNRPFTPYKLMKS